MNIYIYGNESFKKEIHQTLEHSNIKFKIDSNLEIEDINSLARLKQVIEENPENIFLIDDEKIIKKNSLNKKFKFLAPKDGIEEDFLLKSGIADLSLDSMKELPKYIIKKYEESKPDDIEEIHTKENFEVSHASEEELDDELSKLLEKGSMHESNDNEEETFDNELDLQKDINLDDIDDFISNLTDSKKDELPEINNLEDVVDFNDSFGLNNISYDYDDDDIMFKEENITIDKDKLDDLEEFDFFDQAVLENDEDLSDFSDLNLENDFNFLDTPIEEPKFELSSELSENIKQINESFEGDKMSDEFFELDSISEKDLLEALNYKIDEKSSTDDYKPSIQASNAETLTINSSNVNDLSQLISKLLTNKTLEITIKIKD